MTDREPPYDVGPWRVLARRTVYDNPWIRVEDHAVRRPDGGPGQYGVIRFKNRAIGVLPVDDDGMVRLVGQHRFALDRYSWELPEGGGPIDEDPLAAAQRELAEETGLTAAVWIPLIEADLSNSVTDEQAVCFIACDLSEGAADPDPTEALAIRTIPFTSLLEEVMTGQIRDSLTVMMTLAARVLALQGGLPERISRHLAGGRRDEETE
jgi:8-oxo-dGTP pyrophosphatase MutT (NUDIX family)